MTSPAASSHPAGSDEEETPHLPPTPQQLSFAKEYVKVINSDDLDGLRRLVAPKTLACYSDRTRPFLDEWLTRQLRDRIADPYTITIEPRSPEDFLHSALIILPVVPNNQLDIATRLNGKDVILGRPIAFQDGRWYLAAPCPTDMGMEHFLKRQARERETAAKVDLLYSQLKDPMLSQLRKLIAQNKGSEACAKYSSTVKVKRNIACMVIARLAATMGQPLTQ